MELVCYGKTNRSEKEIDRWVYRVYPVTMNNRLRNGIPAAPVNINDIASELGVSKTTVSRAISGKGRIGNETREKVLALIEERGYSPNLIAKSLAVSKTFNIAVAIPRDTDVREIPFFQECLYGITRAVEAREYDVVLSITTGEDISSLKRIIRNRKVDGFILTRPLAGDKAIAFMETTSLPFVVIGSPETQSVYHVDSDHRDGCRKATGHVLLRGFTRHVLLGGNPDHRVNRDRLNGYLDAIKKGDGTDYGDTGQIVWGMDGLREIESVLPGIMRTRPQCLICMDDVIATHALAWLYRKGFSIPEDIALVSFHDSAAMETHYPPISALHINVQKLASLAGNTILDRIEGKKVKTVNLVPSRFIVRDSSRAR